MGTGAGAGAGVGAAAGAGAGGGEDTSSDWSYRVTVEEKEENLVVKMYKILYFTRNHMRLHFYWIQIHFCCLTCKKSSSFQIGISNSNWTEKYILHMYVNNKKISTTILTRNSELVFIATLNMTITFYHT